MHSERRKPRRSARASLRRRPREGTKAVRSASTQRRSGNCVPSWVPRRSRKGSVSRAAASIARRAQRSLIDNQSGKALASSSRTFCSGADTSNFSDTGGLNEATMTKVRGRWRTTGFEN